jgi:hypothetical protein
MIKPEDLKDNDIWSMLRAARDGDLTLVKALAGRRPDLVRCEYNYTPPIHFAVREGHVGVVRFLLEQGADGSAYRTYPFQDSLLTMAEDREYSEIVQLLLNVASKRFPVVEGLAEFLDAVQKSELARVREMLAANPKLARHSDDTGDTGLHRAAAIGHFELMGLLLDFGAEVDAVRGDGFRPIHCALKRGRKAVLNAGAASGILLARGAAYNIYIAAVFGDQAYVRYGLLGFAVGNRVPRTGVMNWAWLYGPDAPDWRRGPNLMLTRSDRAIDGSAQATVLYLYATNLVALREELINAGQKPGPIRYPDYLPKGEFDLNDPDGYKLMIAQNFEDTP